MQPTRTRTVRIAAAVLALASALAGASQASADDLKHKKDKVDSRLDDAKDSLKDSEQRAADAQERLARTRAKLSKAQGALARAKDAAAAAASRYRAATDAADQAHAEVVDANRAVRDAEADVTRMQGEVDDVARWAYMNGGAPGLMALMLTATSVSELADQAGYSQAVAAQQRTILARLDETKAALGLKRAQAVAAEKRAQARLADAAAALDEMVKEQQAAKAAALQVAELADAQTRDWAAAKKAVAQDTKEYQELLAESRRLAEQIRKASQSQHDGKDYQAGAGDLARPGNGNVSSPFGMRFHPVLKVWKLHTGTDFSYSNSDGLVHAADDGTVIEARYNVAYGNMTVVYHGTWKGKSLTTLYAHQSAQYVHVGDKVKRGQTIGHIGSTGYATGPHLHFEVRLDGEPVNPAPWLGLD